MFTNSKIALFLALVLAAASTASAAPKRTVHHQTAIQQQVPASAYLSLGAVRSTVHSTGSAIYPSNMKIQDIGLREDLGN
jgi:hypothetical protein